MCLVFYDFYIYYVFSFYFQVDIIFIMVFKIREVQRDRVIYLRQYSKDILDLDYFDGRGYRGVVYQEFF